MDQSRLAAIMQHLEVSFSSKGLGSWLSYQRVGLLGCLIIVVCGSCVLPLDNPQSAFVEWKDAVVSRDVERLANVSAFSSEKQKEHYILWRRFIYQQYDLIEAIERYYGPMGPSTGRDYQIYSRGLEQALPQVSFNDAAITRIEVAGQECLFLRFKPVSVNVYGEAKKLSVELTLVKVGIRWLVRPEEKNYVDIDDVLRDDRDLLERIRSAPGLIGKPGYSPSEILNEVYTGKKHP